MMIACSKSNQLISSGKMEMMKCDKQTNLSDKGFSSRIKMIIR